MKSLCGVCVALITDEDDNDDDYKDDDDESDDTGSDGYKSISHRDYDDELYGFKSKKKKKVYLPVFVPDQEKKKSKIFHSSLHHDTRSINRSHKSTPFSGDDFWNVCRANLEPV